MGIIYRLLKATGKVWRLGEGRRKQNSLLYRLQLALFQNLQKCFLTCKERYTPNKSTHIQALRN